jgi:hypothetical protein
MQTMEDAVKALRDGGIVTSEEANRVLAKAAEANLSEEEMQKVEAIKNRNNTNDTSRKGINVGLAASDPTLQGKTSGGATAPIQGTDNDYSF